MNNLIFKISYSIVVILLVSCSSRSQDEVNNDMLLQKLSGEWTWVKSTGSIAGITVTPESSGRTMEIEFTSNQIFNKNVDGNLVYTSPFMIDRNEIEFTTIVDFDSVGLGLDHQPHQQIEFVGEKNLLLIDRCCDNFSFEFVKKE